jgi:hypothetical protein
VETTKLLWIAHLKLKEVDAKDGHKKIQDSNTPFSLMAVSYKSI